MRIEEYDHQKHYALLKKWLGARNIFPDPCLLPRYGLCIGRTAIGFLESTDSGKAYIENIAANPEASKSQRDGALKILLQLLEKRAMDSGKLVVVTLSQNLSMQKRLLSLNWNNHGQYSLFYKGGF